MKKNIIIKLFTFVLIANAFLLFSSVANATMPLISPPLDLPPEAIDFDGDPIEGNIFKDPNIMAAMIGVGGLILGSFITILATYFMRWMDNRREDKREDLLILRNKKEKEYLMKQDIYKTFLNELANLETFTQKDADEFKREWNRAEIKVDLIASVKVRGLKQKLQEEVLSLASKNIKDNKAHISDKYMKVRDNFLEAVREDLDILQPEK